MVCGCYGLVHYNVFHEGLGGSEDGHTCYSAVPAGVTRGLAVRLFAVSAQRYGHRRETRRQLRTDAWGFDRVAVICLLETGTSPQKSNDGSHRSLIPGFHRRTSVTRAGIVNVLPGKIDQTQGSKFVCIPGIESHAFHILLQLTIKILLGNN